MTFRIRNKRKDSKKLKPRNQGSPLKKKEQLENFSDLDAIAESSGKL